MIGVTHSPAGVIVAPIAEISTLTVARFAPGERMSAAARVIEDESVDRLRALFAQLVRSIDAEIPDLSAEPASRFGARILVELRHPSSPPEGWEADLRMARESGKAFVAVVHHLPSVEESARIFALATALLPTAEAA